MSKYIAYGFANTNRSDTIAEHTLAYKQLEIFHADRIIVDIHWHSERREKLEELIATMEQGDVLYMYSVDTLLKGKNKGVEYYKQILEKNISLLVLDLNGDLPRISSISTFFPGDDISKILSDTEKATLISKMEDIAKNYVSVAQTGKTTYKANITAEFKELYFMYEAYRINEKQMLNLIADKLGMTTKQTFISLCREYEKSIMYIEDFEKYCDYDPKFLELPKRTGKLPREYDDIMALANQQTESSEKERIQKALDKMQIWSNSDIIHRWKLLKDKVPKPRKSDGRKISQVFC